MESSPGGTDSNATDSTEQESKGPWYTRFIKGELGLAWTFWYHGIFMLFVLKFVGIASYAVDQSGNLAFFIAAFTVAYLGALLVAVCRAAQKYKGSQVWAVLAVLIVIVAILNWLAAMLAYLKHTVS